MTDLLKSIRRRNRKYLFGRDREIMFLLYTMNIGEPPKTEQMEFFIVANKLLLSMERRRKRLRYATV